MTCNCFDNISAAHALAEKKGEDITVIDISNISVIADYFVITHGTSDSQVSALVDHVEEKLAESGYHLQILGKVIGVFRFIK